MPCVRRQKIPREEFYSLAATLADNLFHPQEVLHVGFFTPAQTALCSIKVANLSLKLGAKQIRSLIISCKVKMLDFLLYDPVGHWVDVKTRNITTKAVRFQERGASTHEWVGDSAPHKLICLVESLAQRSSRELSE